jgi:hypothetical protein
MERDPLGGGIPPGPATRSLIALARFLAAFPPEPILVLSGDRANDRAEKNYHSGDCMMYIMGGFTPARGA